MRVIISPAKKMVVDIDSFACSDLPAFIDDAEALASWVRALGFDRQKELWACSDAIAEESSRWFADMDLRRNLTPALLAYDGIQYTYMAPAVFEDGQFDWVQDHVRILSGFYGVLRPFDGVVPYRLEMQAKVHLGDAANLYAYWGARIYEAVMQGNDDRVLVNLASKEYSKAVEKHLQTGDTYLTCVFGELDGDKVVQKGVYAKMARGEMVRYLASVQATGPESLKGFAWSGYAFDPARSTETTYVFVRDGAPHAR